MQRRSFIKNTAFSMGALALLNQSSLAQFLAAPAWKIKMLTAEIGIFSEKGGTILFMITKKGVVVIDAQFPDTAQHLIDEIKNKQRSPSLDELLEKIKEKGLNSLTEKELSQLNKYSN